MGVHERRSLERRRLENMQAEIDGMALLSDYGAGDFERKGLILFTIRNGSLATPGSKTYAEKIMT